MNEIDLDFKAFLRRHPDLSWKKVAVFCKLDRLTRNGHVYSRELWERELARFTQPIIGGIHLGVNPEGVVRLDNAAFAIEHPRVEGDEVKGDLVLLDTEAGRLLRQYMEAGGRMWFASMGIGRIDGNGVVQDDFQFQGVTAVPEPSLP